MNTINGYYTLRGQILENSFTDRLFSKEISSLAEQGVIVMGVMGDTEEPE